MCRLSCMLIYLFYRFLKRTCSSNKNMHVLQKKPEMKLKLKAQEKSFTVKNYSFVDMFFKLLRYLTPVFPTPQHFWLNACYYSIHSSIFITSCGAFICYVLGPQIFPKNESNTAEFLIFTTKRDFKFCLPLESSKTLLHFFTLLP